MKETRIGGCYVVHGSVIEYFDGWVKRKTRVSYKFVLKGTFEQNFTIRSAIFFDLARAKKSLNFGISCKEEISCM